MGLSMVQGDVCLMDQISRDSPMLSGCFVMGSLY